jgi:protein SERAC1
LRDRALVPSKIVDTEGQLPDALQEGSEVLANITDMFVLLMKDFHFFFFFFWEQEKTNMGVTQDHGRQSSSLDRDFRC